MMARDEEARAARDAKLEALHERLTAAVEALVTGDDWCRAMEFAARFRSRSFNNTLLIYVQHYAAFEAGRVPEPMPTRVAGFHQWHDLGRSVMRGQSGYQIFAPVTARMASREPADPSSWRRLGRGEKPAAGEVVRSRMIGAKPAHVWDISQTDGPPVPELPAPKLLTGQAPPGLWDGLARIVAERGFNLHDAPDADYLDGANGLTHWLKRTVHVRLDMDDAARVRTLSHEVGHVVLHDRDNVDAVLHRGVAEVEAESVALMIGAAHGMDTTAYTIPYVTGWAGTVQGKDPAEVVQATGERVRKAAGAILDALPTTQIGASDPPGLVHDPEPVEATTRVEQSQPVGVDGARRPPAGLAARSL